MTITVVMPVLTARAEIAKQVMAAYARTTPGLNLRIVHDPPTAGAGWQQGADHAPIGDYIHLTADDLEPLEGWWIPLKEAVDAGCCPAPIVLNPDRTIQSCGANGWELNTRMLEDWAEVEWTTVPFMSADQWGRVQPIPAELHYCTDTWVSARLAKHGVRTVARPASHFLHHNHPAGRGAGMDIHERNRVDRARYAQLIAA
jgi:hypothetical protein